MASRLALALLLAPLALASAAHGATIQFSDTFGPAALPVSVTPLATVPLSLFDPALGTLTKVTLTLDANTSGGTIAWDNEAPISTDITLGIGGEVTAVGLAGVTAIAVPLQTDSATGIDADNDGAADFIGTDAFSVVGGSGSDSDSGVLTSGLAPYIGLGTFDVTVSGVYDIYLSTTGGFGPVDPVAGITDGTVTVTYEYTPVPEPSTALLVAGGLLGLGAQRRGRA